MEAEIVYGGTSVFSVLPKEVLLLIAENLQLYKLRNLKYLHRLLILNKRYNQIFTAYWSYLYKKYISVDVPETPKEIRYKYILALKKLFGCDSDEKIKYGLNLKYDQFVINRIIKKSYSSEKLKLIFYWAVDYHCLRVVKYLGDFVPIDVTLNGRLDSFLVSFFWNIDQGFKMVVYNNSLPPGAKKITGGNLEHFQNLEKVVIDTGVYLITKGVNFENLPKNIQKKLMIKCGFKNKKNSCNRKVKPGTLCWQHQQC